MSMRGARNRMGVHLTPESFVLSSQPDGSRFVNLDAVSRKCERLRSTGDEVGPPSFASPFRRNRASGWSVSPHEQPKCWARRSVADLTGLRARLNREARQPRDSRSVIKVHSDDDQARLLVPHSESSQRRELAIGLVLPPESLRS